jgi:hypothetical protein
MLLAHDDGPFERRQAIAKHLKLDVGLFCARRVLEFPTRPQLWAL